MASDDTSKNRRYWDGLADDYQAKHGVQLKRNPLAWGAWSIPEREVGALGPVEGNQILELGCGSAHWSVSLAETGAFPIGLDNSFHHLGYARRLAAGRNVRLPLVQASADELPFNRETFDVVFCDHGGMTYADPRRTVPEAARVLRSGGLFVFNMTTPLVLLCFADDRSGRPVDAPFGCDYFGMHRLEREFIEYQLPYGDWIRLFRQHGFVIEDLIELRPPVGATTSYVDSVSYEWARRWPAEHIWKVRKSG